MRGVVMMIVLSVLAGGCPHSHHAGGGGGGGGPDHGLGGAPALVVGTPVLLASATQPEALATDATHVYWIAEDGERVDRVAKTGGVVETIARRAEDEGLTGLAVDADWIYFATTAGRIVRTHKTADAAEEVLYTDLNAGPLYLHAGQLTWTQQTAASESQNVYELHRGAAAGGGGGRATVLATLPARVQPPLAIADDAVYGADFATGEVWRLAAGEVAPQLLATQQIGPVAVALAEDGFVYWANSGGSLLSDNPGDGTNVAIAAEAGAIVAMPVSGGAPDVLLAQLDDPTAVQVDGETIYYVQFGKVLRVARTGGAPALVSEHEERVVGLLIDASGLYWCTANEVFVLRRANTSR